ncbi:TPA: DUF2871 domain-containing protein [Streptococcus suis]
MRKQSITALIFMIIGLLSGLFYREYTKMTGFTGQTQLSTVHTHAFALGMLFFLIVLALEANFRLTHHKHYGKFFGFYVSGLSLSLIMQVVRGMMQVQNVSGNGAIPGLAGVGHILLTIGLGFFMKVLLDQVKVFEGHPNT